MPRRKTKWWSGLAPTPPKALLKRPEGKRLVESLTRWWLTSEGVDGTTAAPIDQRRRAIRQRYSRERFYAMLDEAYFPALTDRDEHTIDAIHGAFVDWACSRKAGKLRTSVEADLAARRQISGAAADSNQDLADALADSLGDVINAVSQHVHHQVSHAITHAAHHSGSAGGHGGHGGH